MTDGYPGSNMLIGIKELGCKLDEKLGREYCTIRELSLEYPGEPVVSVIEHREYRI